MKIIVVGNGTWPWYEAACSAAIAQLNCEVFRINSFDYLQRWVSGRSEPVFQSLGARVQNRLLDGPVVRRFNREIIQQVSVIQPDVVFFYNSPLVFPRTVEAIRAVSSKTRIVQYVNDNPFSPLARKFLWRHLIPGIPKVDINFVFRHSNILEFQAAGARHVELLRGYYVREMDFKVERDEIPSALQSDVVFAGHFESDGRLATLRKVAETGVDLKIFGGGWGPVETHMRGAAFKSVSYPIVPVVGEHYRKAISGAKIALCFLSKINKDTYTTRNFQIPAMESFMLSEYSEDLASLFAEGQEAEFFRDDDELLDKVAYYLENDSKRTRIARAGKERVVRDHHEVQDRMKQMLDALGDVTTVRG